MISLPSSVRHCRAAVFFTWLLMAVSTQPAAAIPESLLDPPIENGPCVVRAQFQLQDINSIDDEAETFEFNGVLVLTWKDPRQAFDPEIAGVREKIYQGGYQFDEVSPAWYPQVVLANESGLYESDAVILRLQPDGTSTLISTINAVAETDFNMRRYPFDKQRLEAVFELVGFDTGEVVLEAGPGEKDRPIHVSQWDLSGIETAIRNRDSIAVGSSGKSSEFVVTFNVQRDPMFTLRLVGMPLALIVMLSWSVFWMERSSLGDRIGVSFVGILTAVAYQIVVGDLLPHVSYITVMHGFLNFSFLVMCASVVINLVVGACDKNGKHALGELIDRRCRWIFPLAYLGLLSVIAVIAIAFF
jgi:Neurotransmitter-gated ion-channel ligand binding domain/Neurotransmitter-gated ion-channel transmembrane region